jgi:ATP-dependent phosphoenolpyruvate carboxykinase
MSKETNVNVPFQVEQLINSMLNPRDNLHLRGNYRARLDVIQHEINKAIKKYDHEVNMSEMTKGKKRG